MANQTSRPTLVFHLGKDAVLSLSEKGLLGGVYMRFARFLMAALWQYQTGAVLGRARRDRLEILARMLCSPGQEGEFCDSVALLAGKRIDRYGKEPDSFFDFLFTTEYQHAGINWPEDYRGVMRMAKKKIPLKELAPLFEGFMLEGVAFGAAFPELTERMWRGTYETFDPEARELARRYGVDVPEQFTPVPLEQREQEVLAEVAVYSTEHFPELVEPLGLRLS